MSGLTRGGLSFSTAAGSLLKLGVWGITDQALLSACNFLTLILIARETSAHDFGSYALALAIVTFVMSIQSALLNKPFVVLSASRSGPHPGGWSFVVGAHYWG